MSVNGPLHSLARILLSAISSVFGWVFVAPLACIVPKRRDWIAVVGRNEGEFLDNAKYFYLQARQLEPDLRLVFISMRPDNQLPPSCSQHGAMPYPALRSIWYLLRCNVLVTDESAWFRHARFFLLARARVVQLWHGIPFKRIELDRWRHEAGANAWASRPLVLRLRLLGYRVTGRWTRYAAVSCPSHFYRDEVFRRALRARHFPVIGYPRNDFALSLRDENRKLAWSNVDETIQTRLPDWRQRDRRIVLVAPTFRDSGTAPMRLDPDAVQAIDVFAEEHRAEFVFKFHPAERNANHVGGRHFHVCARDSDIYPLLPHAAAMVTDYSSISMDFLLVDRPLLFLIPDDDDYATNDRQLQFDPRAMALGPVVCNWAALLASLKEQWARDSYSGSRAAACRKAFDGIPQAEAVPRLIAFMRSRGWVSPRHPECDD